MQKTKFSFFISILVFALSLNSFAQTNEKPINLKGKWALQFQIDRYFTLSEFQGGTISGKYHLNNSSAIRFGARINTTSDDSEGSLTMGLPDTTMSSSRNSTTSYQSIMFLAEYLHYSAISDNIAMYLGAGVNYSTNPRTVEETYIDNNTTSSPTMTDEVEWTEYGVQLLIGVEWFVRSNIGLTAEYSSRYYSAEREATSTFDDGDGSVMTETYNSSYSGFDYDYVKFGVSIYF